MKIRVVGSTKPGYVLPVKDALLFAGHEAGICYMADDFDTLQAEPEIKTLRRVEGTVGSGHHSVSGHAQYNLVLEGLPKIVAMILNNEHDYETSEKSARYTKMDANPEDILDFEVEVPRPTGVEKAIYEKWIGKFTALIHAEYPQIDEKTADKLAKENARYFLSVFTPATTMGHTLSLRQMNYIVGFCDDFVSVNEFADDPFLKRLCPWLKKLCGLLKEIADVDGLRDNKGRQFSLFAKRLRQEEFGENYCTNYYGSFAQLAQAQRHRTLIYEMMVPQLDSCQFFVPPIIQDAATRAEYLADMDSLKANYPQGMLVHINERGTPENFILKCHERLCGAAQLEICHQTNATLQKYMSGVVRAGNSDVYKLLAAINGKTKCQLGYYRCDRPCPLGPQNCYTRKI